MNILVQSIETLPNNQSDTPVLRFCRKLVKDNIDPRTQLQITRNGQTTLIINDIYAAAKLTVKEDPSVHFAKYKLPSDKIIARRGGGLGV